MFCSISGSVPDDPVVSKVSGHLFERRLVEKHIQETGKDPLSGEESSVDDLIAVKTNKAVKPRPSPATSIPGLLSLFHNEWDAVMLEQHALRQSLEASRQELAHALYQQDAAVRTIARLMRERDGARAALEAAAAAPPPALEQANGKRAADGDEPAAKRAKAGITEDIVEAMTQCSNTLSKGRKKRQVSPNLATPEDVAAFTNIANQPLHKTSKGGILAIDLSPSSEGVVATAGVDALVEIFDRGAARIIAQLSGHSKKVNDVKFLGEQGTLVTASADKTARMWTAGEDGAYTAAAVLKEHTGEVTAVTLHPLNDYFVTASTDKTWAFYDAKSATCLTQVADPAVEGGFTCAAFHPDGVILGTGTEESLVRVWEVRQQKCVAKFEGHSGSVTGLSFSENGYYLATCATDGVKLWDLRKLKNFKSLAPYADSPTTAVAFDHSGLYLGVGGMDARIYGIKQDWSVVKTFPDQPKKGVMSLKFGADSKTLFVGASDHNLRIYGLAASEDAQE